MKNGFFRLPLAGDQAVGDLAGDVGRVVSRILGTPVVVGRRPELLGQLRQHPCQPAGVGRHLDVRELHQLAGEVRVAPGPQPAVRVHHEVVVVVGRHVEQPAPGAEAGRDLPVGVQRSVAVQPLPDKRGPVAVGLQPGGQGVGAIRHAIPAVGVEVPCDSVVVGVLAGDERRPRRAAEGERVDRIGELRPLVHEQLPDVWHELQVAGRHVIGHDDEDVRVATPASARAGRGPGNVCDADHGEEAHHGDPDPGSAPTSPVSAFRGHSGRS